MKANRKLLGDCVFKHRQAGYSPLLTPGNCHFWNPPPFCYIHQQSRAKRSKTRMLPLSPKWSFMKREFQHSFSYFNCSFPVYCLTDKASGCSFSRYSVCLDMYASMYVCLNFYVLQKFLKTEQILCNPHRIGSWSYSTGQVLKTERKKGKLCENQLHRETCQRRYAIFMFGLQFWLALWQLLTGTFSLFSGCGSPEGWWRAMLFKQQVWLRQKLLVLGSLAVGSLLYLVARVGSLDR